MDRLPDALREHLQQPRNVGEPDGGADLRGEARNAACGDVVVLFLKLGAASAAMPGPPARLIVEAGFLAQGCPASMTTASAACELLPGLPADESLPDALEQRFLERFGTPRPAHRHAMGLVREALRQRREARPQA